MPLTVAAKERFPPAPWDTLCDMGVKINVQQEAQLRIGLLNLMPAPSRDKTVEQFCALMAVNSLNIAPVLMRFDEYIPKSGREGMLAFYEPFSEVREKGLDGLIVTGANLELRPDGNSLLPVSEILYHEEWTRVLDWARANVRSTIFSCLASHVALEHYYGIPRAPLGTTTYNNASGTLGQYRKTFGLYKHAVDHTVCPALTRGMNDLLAVPHSRWGDVPIKAIMENQSANLRVVGTSDEVGWQILVGEDAKDIYLQGHPEYYPRDLEAEYLRDKKLGMEIKCPAGYYPDDDDTKPPVVNWRADAHVFYRNWLEFLNTARDQPKLSTGPGAVGGGSRAFSTATFACPLAARPSIQKACAAPRLSRHAMMRHIPQLMKSLRP